MKIALNYRNVDPNRGGAETYVADLTRSLIQRGHEVTLVAEHVRPGAVPDSARHIQVPVQGWTRSGKIWSFAENSQAIMIANQDRFDATMGFINTWHHDVIIPQGGLRAGSIHHNAQRFSSALKRDIYKLSKQLSPSEWKYDRIERLQYDAERKARVVAVSRLVAGHLQRFRGVDPQRIHVVYNAIDPDRFHVADHEKVKRETRHAYGLKPSDHVGLFVGHNFWLKGLEPLLKALSVRRTNQKIQLLVSGGGKIAAFHSIVKKLGLEDSVKLLGFTNDIRSLFHAADFFVSPTYYDPCSLVVMEALACGLPVITTACNGAGELVTQGVEGFVVPTPNHQTELVQALDAMTDKPQRDQMAQAARELGRRQTFDAHVSKLEDIFAQVSAEKVSHSSRQYNKNPHFGVVRSHGSKVFNPGKESERGY